MNSIDDRIARLKKKNKEVIHQTTKHKRLEDIRRTELYRQGNCCAACGISFEGNKVSKPVIDYTENVNGNVRGVVCEHCEVVIRSCGNNVDRLNRIGNYMRGSVRDKFLTQTEPFKPVQKPGEYFDVNDWSKVK
jgi:hypothetical protein